MSVSYIDLSSDEELEIITEKKVNDKPLLAERGTDASSVTSAVEKLKKNSSIELTIDLENEKNTVSKPKTENGFHLETKLRQLLTYGVKHKPNGDNPPQQDHIVSSDIIIIDNDEKEEEQPNGKVKIESTTKNGDSNNKIALLSNNSRRNSAAAEKLEASKVVEENGDEVYVIDDDDDDDVTTSGQMVQIKNIKTLQQLSTAQNQAKDCQIKNKNTVTKRQQEPQPIVVEKTVNLKKVVLNVSKSPKKSPQSTSVTSDPLKLPAISMNSATPLMHLSIPVVSLSTNLMLPSSVTSALKVLAGKPSDDVVDLSDEPEPTKDTSREFKPVQQTEQEQDPLAIMPSQQASSRSCILPKSNNGYSSSSSEQSSSKTVSQKDLLTRFGIDNISQEPINKYSVENMFDGLVKVSCKIFQDENLGTRLWRYFRAASEEVLMSADFLNAVKLALKSAEDVKNPSIEDKLIVSRNLKEVMRILKRTPERVNKTLRKLNRTLQIINERIHKLETMEVTSSSDEENENVYCLLDRYRTKASKIYGKICELEGKAAHAGRATLQKFHFSGTSGYAKIEHVLEKYFNKTREFPDFLDVKKLIEATVLKEKFQLSQTQIHNIAQSLFLEFGNKLQRMRKCDDYTILVDYLDDGTKDPALDDEGLFRKLEENKKTRKKEEEILAHYTMKQAELRSKGEIKSDEEAADNDSEVDGTDKEDELNKKDLQFSDTEDELINEEIDSGDKKRKLSCDEDTPSQPFKKMMSEVDKMEVNLKLLTDVPGPRTYSRRQSSTEKDHMMDQLGLTSKGKQGRI